MWSVIVTYLALFRALHKAHKKESRSTRKSLLNYIKYYEIKINSKKEKKILEVQKEVQSLH